MLAAVRSSYETPLGLITMRSSPGTRAETLPDVHATSPYRVSSACSVGDHLTVDGTSRSSALIASTASLLILRRRCITSLPPRPK